MSQFTLEGYCKIQPLNLLLLLLDLLFSLMELSIPWCPFLNSPAIQFLKVMTIWRISMRMEKGNRMTCWMRLIMSMKEVEVKMQRMVLTGCLRMMKSQLKIPTMFSALHLTAGNCCTYLHDIFVSILYLWNMMDNGPQTRSTMKLFTTCIASAIHMAYRRFGVTCGHAGTHQKCGISGHNQHSHIFHVSEQP